jgi:hypothetical protein
VRIQLIDILPICPYLNTMVNIIDECAEKIVVKRVQKIKDKG